MAGRISRADIDEVRARTDILAVIGQYVTLKSAGVGSYKGLCPFHEERSPSFNVRPQVGFYHCFGCGEGGDVFTFLQKMEGISFTEAVQQLADRLGMTLHTEDGGAAQAERGQRVRILAANDAAAEFYRRQLGGSEAASARQLLVSRHFGSGAAAHFGLGYAPASWDALRSHLHGQGFTDDELLAAGLVTRGNRGVYDRFRGRLIWPIREVTGRTVGFGARRLADDDQGPKYLNTPETVLYHKANVLYGLDLAKRSIAKRRQVVVVEGYTDVMACHLAGVDTAVATCGTAFGEGHVEVIRRILGDDNSQPAEVIFTFDPDDAGRKAALRAFAQERRFIAQTYVAVAPDGLDPSDLRQQRGDAAIRAMLTAKTPLFEFVLRDIVSRYDLDTVEGRAQALRNGAPIVAAMRNRALLDGYTRLLAGMIGVDVVEARAYVRQSIRSDRDGEGRPGPARAPRPEAAVAHPAPAVWTIGNTVGDDPRSRLEQQVLEVWLQVPSRVRDDLLRESLQVPLHNQRLDHVRELILAGGAGVRVQDVLEAAGEDYTPLIQQLAVSTLPLATGSDEETAAYANGVCARLLDDQLGEQKHALLRRLSQFPGGPGDADYVAMQREIAEIEDHRRRLQPMT
jgi:DNA primase